MNNNQSIDEILRQLKTSVSSEQPSEESTVTENDSNEYSDEILKRELKNQYFSDNDDAAYVSENEYSIDNDFLNEAESFKEESLEADTDLAETAENVLADESADEAKNLVVIETSEDSDSGEVIEELVEAIDTFTEDVEDVSEMFEYDFEDEADDNAAENAESIDATTEDIDNADECEAAVDINEPIPEATDDLSTLVIEASDLKEFDEEFETENYEQDIVYTAIELDSESTVEVDATAEIDAEKELEPATTTLMLAAPETATPPEENAEAQTITEQPEEQANSKATYISMMRNSGIDLSANDATTERTPAVQTMNENVEENEELFEGISDNDPEDLDLSTINLMMQLGEREEVAERIGNKNIENIIEESEAAADAKTVPSIDNSGEYVSRDQDETIRAAYKKKYIASLFSMCGCIILAIMSLIFDALPIFEVSLSGIFDYTQYPSFYILVGLQFVIFTAAVCIKQLKKGVQGILTAAPNRYSLLTIIIFSTVIYGILIASAVAIGGDVIPPLFNGMAATVMAISAIIDFIKITADTQTFNVYSSDATKFTLVDERQQGRIAEKMYAGGLETTKKIYSAASVDFPRGFFDSISDKDGQSRSVTMLMIISVLISVIVTVVAAIISLDIYASFAAFMICMFASMPVCLVCADNIPLAMASLSLSKRGIAIAGKDSVHTHSKCDVMVFGDLHMFKKCKTEDIGIAMYDKGVSYLALGCISALYSKIGGPLSGMDMNLPDVFKFQNVDIRRVTRSGIEAVIDKKHVLVLGERSFLLRYGIVFPEDENQSDRCSLCVSLNGGTTAKLSIKYEPEPVFEMLIERLHAAGVTCAIETYDPLINSDMISKNRTLGSAPVSVVHKNAEDFRLGTPDAHRGRRDGVIACASRLKLAELQVWVKKLARAEKITKIFSAACCGVGVLATILMVALTSAASFNQYHTLIYLFLQLAAFSGILLSTLPSKKYFTVEELYDELERKSIIEQRKLERAAQNNQAFAPSEAVAFENYQKESDTDE